MAERFSGRCACGGIRFVSKRDCWWSNRACPASSLLASEFFWSSSAPFKVRHVQRFDNLELIVEHLEQHLARACSYAVKYPRSFVSAALTMRRLTG
jgi:hypothetical protein